MESLYHILTIVLIILGILLLIKLISAPIRWAFKLLINAATGFIVLFIANQILSVFFGLTLEITFWKALIAGLFGIPGAAVLILIEFFL